MRHNFHQNSRSFFFVLFCFVVMLPFSHLSEPCPSECTCKWKGGKKTAECIGVNLVAIPEGLSGVTQVLDLTGNLLQLLPSKAFQSVGLVNLQKIYASRCGLLTIAEDAFYQLSNLVELDLSNNFIRWVPARALRDTPFLRRLLLSHNPIQKVENNSFALLEGLTTLELSNCQIEEIEPAAFDGLVSLQYLILSNNKLRSLPPEVVKPFSTLYALELHQNPWQCDCRIRSVRVWMQRNNVPISSPPQCTEPPRMRGLSWNDVHIDEFACRPEVTAVEPTATFTEGDNATLGCRIHATPESSVNWIWRGRVINNLTLMSFGRQMYLIREVGTTHKVSSLTIFNVMLKDSGRYLCVANNPAGRISTNITLNVSAKEDIASTLSGEQIAGIVIGVLFVIFALFFVFSFFMLRHQRLFAGRGKGGGFTIYKHFFSFNQNHVDPGTKNIIVVDGNAVGSMENDSGSVATEKCNASPLSPGSVSETSAYGVAKMNNVILMEQYSIHESSKVRVVTSPNAEKRYCRTLNRHSIKETEKGIELCVLPPADNDSGKEREDKSWKSPQSETGGFVEGDKTEYIRKLSTERENEEDDVDDRDSGGIVYDVQNPSDGSFFLDSDIPNMKCSIWPLSEGSFKDESYHSYSSPSQSSWKRSAVAIPQQIHHVFSPDARDSPDEGLGDEREYETDILD